MRVPFGCCANCFNNIHTEIITFIKTNGKPNWTCAYCGLTNTSVIEPIRLKPLFDPLLSCYEVASPGVNMMPDEEAMEVGETLSNYLIEDFSVFSDATLDKADKLLDAILNDPQDIRDEGIIFDPSELWCRRERNFTERSEIEIWDIFCSRLRHHRRFIPDTRDSEVVDPRYGLPSLFERLEKVLQAGASFYRGRKEIQRLDDMGAPSYKLASAGRANPEGIPFLYLATNPETVIAELRPWKGLTVSVAEFTLLELVRVVDISSIPSMPSPFSISETHSLYYLHQDYALLHHLSLELSKPIDPRETSITYLPTQYLAEVIRNEGYDGILYNSAMGAGQNLALFFLDKAKPIRMDYHKITNISYVTSKITGVEKDDLPLLK